MSGWMSPYFSKPSPLSAIAPSRPGHHRLELRVDALGNRAGGVKVTEVNVFGEPPIVETAVTKAPLAEAFRPSRAFPGSFGERTSIHEDGATHLYLTRSKGTAWP